MCFFWPWLWGSFFFGHSVIFLLSSALALSLFSLHTRWNYCLRAIGGIQIDRGQSFYVWVRMNNNRLVYRSGRDRQRTTSTLFRGNVSQDYPGTVQLKGNSFLQAWQDLFWTSNYVGRDDDKNIVYRILKDDHVTLWDLYSRPPVLYIFMNS